MDTGLSIAARPRGQASKEPPADPQDAVGTADELEADLQDPVEAQADGNAVGAAADGDAHNAQAAAFLQGKTRFRQHPVDFLPTLLNLLRQAMVVFKVHVVGTLCASRHTSMIVGFLRYIATPGNTSRLGLQLVRRRRGTGPAVSGPSRP
jgi:hypothetical protein